MTSNSEHVEAVEAVCAGIPVIGTTEVPGPKFSTIEEAAKFVEDLKKNPEKVKQLAKEQYTYVMQHRTYATLVKSWKSVFEDQKKEWEKQYSDALAKWQVEKDTKVANPELAALSDKLDSN